MPIPLHAGCASAPTHDCRILRANVGLDYCLSSCRLVERKNGVCLAFAAAYSSVTAEELCRITAEVSLTSAAENALIHVNAPTSVPVNPPAELEDRIMDSETTPVAPVDANKARTAAATAARLAKIKARKEAEMAARVAAGLPAIEPRIKKKPGPKPGWKNKLADQNPAPAAPSLIEAGLGDPQPAAKPVDTSVMVGPGIVEARHREPVPTNNVMPILIFVETAPNSAIYKHETVDMASFLEIVKAGRKVITATEYRVW